MLGLEHKIASHSTPPWANQMSFQTEAANLYLLYCLFFSLVHVFLMVKIIYIDFETSKLTKIVVDLQH